LTRADVEYEQYPRGRVMFNMKREVFLLLADQCILKRPSIVKKIIKELALPVTKTDTGADEHYRCYKCLGYVTES
jgi:hypothetical protein